MYRNSSVAFVASTLPLHILDCMIEEWEITEILVSNEILISSYKYLNIKNPKLKIKSLPKGNIFQILKLALWLINLKIKRKKIFFFHECCCLFFDIFISWFKLNGEYYPQVTLDSFRPIDFSKIDSNNKTKKIIKILYLQNNFSPYIIDLDNNCGESIVWARVKYPKLIKSYCIEASNKIKKTNKFKNIEKNDGFEKVLLILGKDVAADFEVVLIFNKIIIELHKLKLKIYVKDHPNPQFRLNLNLNCFDLYYIDPFLPVEMIQKEFKFVFGVASTGLVHFNDRSISILDFFTSVDPEILKRRKEHLLALPNGNDIKFPTNINEIISIIK
jgi:hypothetical protein